MQKSASPNRGTRKWTGMSASCEFLPIDMSLQCNKSVRVCQDIKWWKKRFYEGMGIVADPSPEFSCGAGLYCILLVSWTCLLQTQGQIDDSCSISQIRSIRKVQNGDGKQKVHRRQMIALVGCAESFGCHLCKAESPCAPCARTEVGLALQNCRTGCFWTIEE